MEWRIALLVVLATCGCKRESGGVSDGGGAGSAAVRNADSGTTESATGGTGAGGKVGHAGTGGGSPATATSGRNAAGNGGSTAGRGSSGRGASAGTGAGAGASGDPTEDDAGSAPVTTCSAMFCEDFESGALDPNVWTRIEKSDSKNTVTVQSARVRHGKYAAQFHARGGTSQSMMFLEKLPTPLQKHYFGRLYFYASGFPSESGGHTAYITSSNGLSGFPYSDHHLEVASYLSGSGPIWQMTYWQGDGPEYIGSGGMIPSAQWFCLEWEFNDAPDQIAIWVDGDPSPRGAAFRNINNNASDMLMRMTTLGVGFRTWHPMGAPDIDIFVDDVALDTGRVGCLP